MGWSWAGSVAVVVVAAATRALAQESPAAPAVPPFVEWLAEVRTEALAKGIRPEIVEQAFAGIEQPDPTILERDRAQAEFTLDLGAYLKRRLTVKVIRTAREMYAQHRQILERVGKQYDVSPRILVSVWGLESNFGRVSGVRPTIPALVTLAYDPRRATMFRRELFDALEILNRGDIELDRLKGSWAGALGQPQFMPSSYLEYAQDVDGDGRRDIWSSPADVFGSVAYYLQKHGWAAGNAWGREVKLPAAAAGDALRRTPMRETGCRAERAMTDPKPLSAWRKAGVRTAAGGLLPAIDTPASLVLAGSRAFLVYGNYEAILGYNCAHSYALAVGLLADRIR